MTGKQWFYPTKKQQNMITHMHTYVWMSMHETWSHTCTHIHACLCMEHDPTHAHIFMHVCACEGVYVCHQMCYFCTFMALFTNRLFLFLLVFA